MARWASDRRETPAVPMRVVDLIYGGRLESIKEGMCLPPPIGCGKEATVFRDELSRREYRISGLCQVCQDTIFCEPPE